jgi:hypothetical protein
MNNNLYTSLLALVAGAFTAFFFIYVVPPAFPEMDILAALGAGFVNPFAAGYATDVILCWVVLAIWVVHERQTLGIRHGWLCLLLGLVPGVVVGFALYLILRARQLGEGGQSTNG